MYRLPALEQPLTLHTHLVVREDAQLLYGFSEKRERELFRELIRLNGVGPKLALALMSGHGSRRTGALCAVPGHFQP